MSGFPILDLVAGIIFIYFLLSIISSSAVEMVMTAFKLRGKMLGKWLTEIFNMDVTLPDGTKQKLGRAIMDHCSVTGLSKPGKAPSYIDAKISLPLFLKRSRTIPKINTVSQWILNRSLSRSKNQNHCRIHYKGIAYLCL
jgi:hypothetical protein